jgi:hypothetical protein
MNGSERLKLGDVSPIGVQMITRGPSPAPFYSAGEDKRRSRLGTDPLFALMDGREVLQVRIRMQLLVR